MIVADTGAVLGLVDAGDRHHAVLRRLFDDAPDAWVLPWAILPEVDYLLLTQLGVRAGQAFLEDLADSRFRIEWGDERDLERARDLNAQYHALKLGLVDGVVMAVAERLKAPAIATLDVRHFGAISISGAPKLLPRDA